MRDLWDDPEEGLTSNSDRRLSFRRESICFACYFRLIQPGKKSRSIVSSEMDSVSPE